MCVIKMTRKILNFTVSSILLLISTLGTGAELAFVNTATMNGEVAIKSWKTLRDDRVVKQDLDYSCGAASLATVMKEFYGLEVSEGDILQRMEDDGAASFQDLSDVAWEYGFNANGLALNFAKLQTLKIPVIAYLNHMGDDHFSVIRGISKNGLVQLADPSWGNRKFTETQFRAMWETRNDSQFKGKILVVMPEDVKQLNLDKGFFSPPEVNHISVEILTNRAN